MKNLILILFVLISFQAFGQKTYYVSQSGSDSNTGTIEAKPFKSIEKINSLSLSNNDVILFKCGETFTGTILIKNPVKLSSYGTGNRPIISGFETVSTWTNEDNGIYSASIKSEMQTNMVLFDGVNQKMVTKPILHKYENISSTSIKMQNTLQNMAGSEIVIRKNPHTWDRCLIDSYSNSVMHFTSHGSGFSGISGNEFFYQNSKETLKSLGDWFHDYKNGKLYVYFGTDKPENHNVKIATKKVIVKAEAVSDITISNLQFEGAIETILKFQYNCKNTKISNCIFKYSGSQGISISGVNSIIDNNYISNCGQSGILIHANDVTVSNNKIDSIALNIGQSNWVDVEWPQIGGIVAVQDSPKIESNLVSNCGQVGIFLFAWCQNAIIKSNTIENTCLNVSDFGAIYLYNARKNVVIESNIIKNAIGINGDANGIYLDEECTNVAVKNNYVQKCSGAAVKLHKASNIAIEGNKLNDNYIGISFENWTSTSFIKNNTVKNNTFRINEKQNAIYFVSFKLNEIPLFGVSDYNTFETSGSNIFRLNQPSIGEVYKDLAYWKAFTKQDGNSKFTPLKKDSIIVKPDTLIVPGTQTAVQIKYYFVSATGNNSNPGTEQRPFKTITFALSKITDNDVLVVLGGSLSLVSSKNTSKYYIKKK